MSLLNMEMSFHSKDMIIQLTVTIKNKILNSFNYELSN